MFQNLKTKMKNKYFWISLISLCVLLLKQLGLEINLDIDGISGTILSILVVLGIINDNGEVK